MAGGLKLDGLQGTLHLKPFCDSMKVCESRLTGSKLTALSLWHTSFIMQFVASFFCITESSAIVAVPAVVPTVSVWQYFSYPGVVLRAMIRGGAVLALGTRSQELESGRAGNILQEDPEILLRSTTIQGIPLPNLGSSATSIPSGIVRWYFTKDGIH